MSIRQERRQCDIAYLPFAISIRALIEQVQKRKHGTLTPSEEWVRLQFCPENYLTQIKLQKYW